MKPFDKKIIPLITILIFIVVSIISTIYSYNYKNLAIKYQLLFNNKKERLIRDKNLAAEIFYNNMLYSDIKINNAQIESLDGNPHSLFDIMNGQPKVVFLYTMSDCHACVDSVFHYLNLYRDSINLNNILLLTSFGNTTDFMKHFQFNKTIFNPYNIKTKIFGTLSENIGSPLLFIVDQSLRARCVYLPNNEVSYLTDKYFQAINKRYFSQVPKNY